MEIPLAQYMRWENKLENIVRIKQATKKGFIECVVGGAVDLSYPNSKTRRGRVQDGGRICPTITAQTTGICVIEKSPNPEKPLDILGKPVIL